MKFSSIKKRLLQKRRQTSSFRSQRRASGIQRHAATRSALFAQKNRRPVQIQTPKCFSLAIETERDNLLDFLKRISAALSTRRQVLIDFSPTVTLHPCGTLYFTAFIETFLHKYPNQIKCKLPKNDVVEQLFQHIGLLKKLGREPRLHITAENVVNWHFATGTDATTNVFKSLLIEHSDAMGGVVTRSSLYDCMSEAVTNTRKHAYPYPDSKQVNSWWMFSQVVDEKLVVAICDLGIGIPRSLLSKPEMRDFFRKLFMVGRQKNQHKELIKIVTSTNRTSTGLAYRGKGLPQMLDFIKNGTAGGFRAQSGYGCYSFDAEKRVDKGITFKHAIKGTLIQWTLPLNF